MAGADTGDERGFTLIEVLVAFTIAAIMLLALMEGTSRGMRSIAAAEARLDLLAHAENALALVGAEIPLEPGVYGGREADHGWRVEITLADDPVPEDLRISIGMQLMSISVAASNETGAEQRLFSLRLAGIEP